MRLRFAFLTVAAFGLSACAAALPEGLSSQDVLAFGAGMEKAGCHVETDAKAKVVQDHTGFDEDKLREISRYMLDQGTLIHEGTGIRLVTGNCADA